VKVDPRALAGIERKIERADEHLRVLHDEMTAWNAAGGWKLTHEVHDQGREHVYRLKIIRPIPIDWAIVLGEAIHNLRSALDQTVYWLSVDCTRHETAFCSFPVYRTTAKFYERERRGKRRGAWTYRSGMNKIRGVGPGPQAFIEALQPYPQRYRQTYCYDVRLMHDLWNQDKHRLVHLWGLRFADLHLLMSNQLAADNGILWLDERLRHDRAIVMKITCDTPRSKMQMDREIRGEITATLSVYGGKRAGGGGVSLWGMYWTVVDVIRKLTSAIGRQDDPINLAVWTAKARR
jgi:hypothetical protein